MNVLVCILLVVSLAIDPVTMKPKICTFKNYTSLKESKVSLTKITAKYY
jgi:hypothetical protein